MRILLRRPCAAGGYQSSSMVTYTEAAGATCSPCPAGKLCLPSDMSLLATFSPVWLTLPSTAILMTMTAAMCLRA